MAEGEARKAPVISYSPKQKAFILAPYDHTLDVAEGSPRSGKTFAAIARYAMHLTYTRDRMHLVIAYSAEQAYRLVIEGDGFGLAHIFGGQAEIKHDDTGAHLLIHRGKRGDVKVYWKGGGKADSVKAITGLSIGSVYFCEINLLHPDMIQECIRRTYAAKDRWMIADLNPPAPRHWVVTQVFAIQDTRWTHWTCRDNPILTNERLCEIEEACKKSPFLYKRDWLGLRAIPDGVIYWMLDPEKMTLEHIPKEEQVIDFFMSCDAGATDATAVLTWVITRDSDRQIKAYVAGVWWYDGKQMPMSEQARDIVQKYIPYMRDKYRRPLSAVYVDPAAKAMRLELQKLGQPTQPADNNSRDAVNGRSGIVCGIEEVQNMLSDGRLLFVDDDLYSNEPIIEEAGLYCYDDKGNPIDAYNHALDALRYGNNVWMKRWGAWQGAPRASARGLMD